MPVALDDEHGGSVERKPGAGCRLARLHREAVHHLEAGGHDLGADDAGDGAARASVTERKSTRTVLHRLRPRHDPHGDADGGAERALRADEHAPQVVAGDVLDVAAEGHKVAVGRDDVDAEDVVGREAVLETVRSAGVLRHVAADRADDLARRVGRVEEAHQRRPRR